jgi:hypothetical protein
MEPIYALIMCSVVKLNDLDQFKCETPASGQIFYSIDACKKRRIELTKIQEPAILSGPLKSHFFYCARSVWERAE